MIDISKLKIVDMELKDAKEVKKFIIRNFDNSEDIPSMSDLKYLIQTGIGCMAVHGKLIYGIALSHCTSEYNSIVLFFLDKDLRKNSMFARMYKQIIRDFDKDLDTYVWSKDITNFSHAAEKVDLTHPLFIDDPERAEHTYKLNIKRSVKNNERNQKNT